MKGQGALPLRPRGSEIGFPERRSNCPRDTARAVYRRVLRQCRTLGRCWVYDGPREVTVLGRRIGVHRFVHEYLRGRLPDGCRLHQTCTRTGCINPNHWQPSAEVLLERAMGAADE